jgi:TolB-like protein
MAVRKSLLVVTSILALGSSLSAQQQPAPTVTVVGFQADQGAHVSPKVLDAMTEDLALRLIESGRYRALDRTWLGIESGSALGPLAEMRRAALDASVDYLVVGRISLFSEVQRPAAPMPRLMPHFGPSYSRFRPAPILRLAPRPDRLRVSVELIDVRSGRALTEASETCTVTQTSGPLRLAPAGRPSSVPLAVAAALVSRPRATSNLDQQLQQTLETIGQAIVRWNPPTAAR